MRLEFSKEPQDTLKPADHAYPRGILSGNLTRATVRYSLLTGSVKQVMVKTEHAQS
jgi:hypothetical protein